MRHDICPNRRSLIVTPRDGWIQLACEILKQAEKDRKIIRFKEEIENLPNTSWGSVLIELAGLEKRDSRNLTGEEVKTYRRRRHAGKVQDTGLHPENDS